MQNFWALGALIQFSVTRMSTIFGNQKFTEKEMER